MSIISEGTILSPTTGHTTMLHSYYLFQFLNLSFKRYTQRSIRYMQFYLYLSNFTLMLLFSSSSLRLFRFLRSRLNFSTFFPIIWLHSQLLNFHSFLLIFWRFYHFLKRFHRQIEVIFYYILLFCFYHSYIWSHLTVSLLVISMITLPWWKNQKTQVNKRLR